jgi:hypothetical protein
MTAAARQLKLGFILHGNGVGWGDWRHSDANPAGRAFFGPIMRATRCGRIWASDSPKTAMPWQVGKASPPNRNGRNPLAR